MAWGVDQRLKYLRLLLAREGAHFPGHPDDMLEFTEFILHVIPKMPPDIRDVMRRYYLEGDTQRLNTETGKPLTSDSRFYQQLRAGRACLVTLINEGRSGRAYRILERKHSA